MPLIVTADRAVASVTAAGDNWEVVSTPTGFRGITSADFADLDYVAGFCIFENGEDYEVYDTTSASVSTLLRVTNISGTVTISRPTTPYKSSNGGLRAAAGSGTHTLVVGMGSGTAARLLRETNPTWKTFTSADATPSVAGYRLFKTNGTTAITAFDDMEAGKVFYVQRGGSDIVITDGASIDCGGVNLTLTASQPSALFMEDGGVAVLAGVARHIRDVVPGAQPQTTLTNAAGVVVPTTGSHLIDTEAAAASDDLDTITLTNLRPGDVFELTPVSAARVTTVKHGTGNITTDNGEDIVLDALTKIVRFKVDAAGTGVVASLIGTVFADPMAFKGTIDASTNPNYPAADAGFVYKISVAGKIGGASGPNVEVNDTLICNVDGSAAGDHATVGANWTILQTNIDPSLYALLSDLASTATSKGASLIGVEDSAGNLTATTVEAALAELAAVKPVVYKPENYAGATEADKWTAMLSAIDAASPKAARVVLTPGKTYTGVIASAVAAAHTLNSILYFEIEGNGATIADNVSYTSGQIPTFISATGARNIVLRNLTLTSQENAYGLENDSGPIWISISDQAKFVVVENVKMTGGWTFVYGSHQDEVGTSDEPSYFLYQNYETKKVGRPLVTFFEGASIIGRNCDFDGSGRDFFLNNPTFVDIDYRTRDHSTSALIVAQSVTTPGSTTDKRKASDIRARIRNRPRTEVTNGPPFINLVARTDATSGLSVSLENIDLNYDVDLENGKVGGIFWLSSQTSIDGGGVDATQGYGHTIDGLRFSGTVRGIAAAQNFIDFDPSGTGFNSNVTPDIIKNVVFDKFIASKASAAASAGNIAVPVDINANKYVFIASNFDGTINGATPARDADFEFIGSSGTLPTGGGLHDGDESTVTPAASDKLLSLDASASSAPVFSLAGDLWAAQAALAFDKRVDFTMDADKTDWNPTDQTGGVNTISNSSVFSLDGGATPRTINSISNPGDGHLLIIRNRNGSNITIAHLGTGTAGNQFTTISSANVTLAAGEAAIFRNDGNFWREIAHSTIDATILKDIIGISPSTGATFKNQIRNSILSPAALTGDVNDWSPTGIETASFVRVAGGGVARNITGVVGGAEGRILTFQADTDQITLVHDDGASSTATNRFWFPASTSVVIPIRGSASVIYNSASGRWWLLSKGF